ncbi:MAG: site-specific integrase, partial [Pseudomonadota bacterium]
MAIEEGCAEATVSAYLSDLKSFLRYIGGGVPAESDRAAMADAALIRGWLAARRAEGANPRSIRRALTALRRYRTWRRGGADDPELARVKGPRAPASKPRPVSEADAHALLVELGRGGGEALAAEPEWVAARDVALATLLWGAGLRISEA